MKNAHEHVEPVNRPVTIPCNAHVNERVTKSSEKCEANGGTRCANVSRCRKVSHGTETSRDL